jgi:hypothetical protein
MNARRPVVLPSRSVGPWPCTWVSGACPLRLKQPTRPTNPNQPLTARNGPVTWSACSLGKSMRSGRRRVRGPAPGAMHRQNVLCTVPLPHGSPTPRHPPEFRLELCTRKRPHARPAVRRTPWPCLIGRPLWGVKRTLMVQTGLRQSRRGNVRVIAETPRTPKKLQFVASECVDCGFQNSNGNGGQRDSNSGSPGLASAV